MSYKRDLDPKFARKIAKSFEDGTKDLYARCALAGSIRRDAPVVHDVDFAVIPRGKNFAAWKESVKARVEKMGGSVIEFGETIAGFRYKGVQVNLFLCPGPNSWGPTYMWATGPKGHTIGMTIKAQKKGLLINSRGIWTRDEPPRLVPARDEEAVAKLLDWKFKPPSERGMASKKRE